MTRRVAYPFLTIKDSAVHAEPWHILINDGDFSHAGDYLADWDMATKIVVRREVSVDWQSAAHALELDAPQLELNFVTRIGTGAGRLPRLVIHVETVTLTHANAVATVELNFPGQELSTVLDLSCELLLTSAQKDHSPLSPRLEGQRVWSDHHRIMLEGEEPRFPIEVANLSSLLGGSMDGNAPWYLDWSPLDWRRDFYGALRLYLNESHTEIIKRIEAEDGPTLQAIMSDVMGQVCERLVLDDSAEDVIRDSEEGTLGAQAARWLGLAWGSCDVPMLRSVLETRPGKFRAAFLALAEPGE